MTLRFTSLALVALGTFGACGDLEAPKRTIDPRGADAKAGDLPDEEDGTTPTPAPITTTMPNASQTSESTEHDPPSIDSKPGGVHVSPTVAGPVAGTETEMPTTSPPPVASPVVKPVASPGTQPTSTSTPIAIPSASPTQVPPGGASTPIVGAGLFLGNSQFSYCQGNLAPLKTFAGKAGFSITPTQQTGSARFVDHTLPAAGTLVNYDFVALTNQEAGWTSYPYSQNLSAATALHTSIVRAGAKTVLWMTYLTGNVPSTGAGTGAGSAAYRDQIVGWWRSLESDLENVSVDGMKRDVLLIPVLELWEAGRGTYPRITTAAACSEAKGFMDDSLHATVAGQYATAILMSTFLTCADPRPVSDPEVTLAPAFKTWARQTAWALFQDARYFPDHCSR